MNCESPDFKRAVASYKFPRSEPIFWIDLNGRRDDHYYPHDPCLFLFRPAGERTAWHKSVADFWASALFNFLEDCGDLDSFNELGETGEYRLLSEDEMNQKLGELLKEPNHDNIAFPSNMTRCFIVYDIQNLKAFVGTDSTGHFAVIWKSWSSADKHNWFMHQCPSVGQWIIG